LGYLSDKGTFFAGRGSPQGRWIEEATAVSSMSVAVVGPAGTPLLGYLSGNSFFAAEGLTPTNWVQEATGVVQMAVAAGTAAGALPVLGYVTTTGTLEILQGPLSAPFTSQGRDVSSLALSSLTDS
jgi:hypothetical protein